LKLLLMIGEKVYEPVRSRELNVFSGGSASPWLR
jgi:hypothetical protein